MEDFEYLREGEVYLDAACQSLRPRPVIKALTDYYEWFNSCGERAKYQWARTTDEKVHETRDLVLKYLNLKKRDYFVAFTLNTTYGLNLILGQIKPELVKLVVTSDIEHNSPFLSSMSLAKRARVERKVVTRNEDGSVNLDGVDLTGALVVMNAASNIDGRTFKNIKEIVKKVHQAGGWIVIDAAQAMAHSVEVLKGVEADAICFSAHKMYAPSLGVMVIRKKFLGCLEINFVGGGMVDDVEKESFQFSYENEEHIYTSLEAGLQAWGEIVALGEAIKWLTGLSKARKQVLAKNVETLGEFLRGREKVHLVNPELPSTTTMSFYVDGLDAHLLGKALASEDIMTRTGYFCVHYYLDHVRHLPPMVRFSLGYHNSEKDIEKVMRVMEKIG